MASLDYAPPDAGVEVEPHPKRVAWIAFCTVGAWVCVGLVVLFGWVAVRIGRQHPGDADRGMVMVLPIVLAVFASQCLALKGFVLSSGRQVPSPPPARVKAIRLTLSLSNHYSTVGPTPWVVWGAVLNALVPFATTCACLVPSVWSV
jgi:hypothetical protein